MTTDTRSEGPAIRRARAADAGMLADLARRTFYDAFAGSCSDEDMQLYLDQWFTPEQLAVELRDRRSTFLIAEVEGAAAGYAKLYADKFPPECITGKDPVELVRLYVEREWLGRGIGPALMQTCLDAAAQAGHRTIYLGVWEWNHRAQAFYERRGFARVGEHTFMMGNDPMTDWWMERAI